MKERIILAFLLFASIFGAAYAQSRRISGKVTDSKGEPLVGVSVVVTESHQTVVTNSSGNYTLEVPANAKTIQFRYIGFETKTTTISSSNIYDVVLSESANDLDEVVITGAYGIQQTMRSASYNAQVVQGEKLNTIRQTDFNNALAGKVAGVQVRSQSVGALGRDTEIRLRGATGFSTGSDNVAIYVVDGTILPSIQDINQDEIEEISVLQGPAAGAIYGSQAANGAVVITTKKGRKTDGVGVQLNIGAQFDYVTNLPKYQDEYAGGSLSELEQYIWEEGQPEEWKALDGKYYHDYSDDMSWGPKMEGQEYIPWYAWYGGHSRSYQTASLTAQPNNAKDFFETGITLNNGVSFSSSGEKLSFKLSYQNQYINGLVPTQSLKKNNINIVSSYDISDHLSVSANFTYNNRYLNGEIDDNYANASTGSFNQWFHRDLDMGILKEMQNYQNEYGIFGSWNKPNPGPVGSEADLISFYQANYWYNPYTYLNNVSNLTNADRYFGNVSLTYKINKDLKITGTYRKQANVTWSENTRSSDLARSAYQTGEVGYYYTGNTNANRRNIEFVANYNKRFAEDFQVNATVGMDLFKYTYKANSANTSGGLSIDNLYTIGNSVNTPSLSNSRTEEAYRAIFATANLGYKDFVFVNGTLRNDWFSTLPAENNDVLSKSVGASFVFSEFTKNSLPWLNFGKLRTSWGETPKALGTNSTNFGAYRYPGSPYSIETNKWNGYLLMNTSASLVDPNIHGAVSQQFEVGLDLAFLKNRISLSTTWFKGRDEGFPYAVTVNGASGYTSLLTNIGNIEREGFEFTLGLIPVSLSNFKWNLNANYAPLYKNDVVELSERYEVYRSTSQGNVWNTTFPTLYHVAGERWGQLIGGGRTYDANGNAIVNANGLYARNSNVNYGSVLPKHTGGVQNTFTFYNNFYVNANIDWQIGGKFASLSGAFGAYSGLTAETAGLNDKGNPKRDAVEDGGGVRVVGVTADGTPVDTYVEATTYYQQMYGNRILDDYVYDLTFVKLREVSLGYNIPLRKLKMDNIFKSADFSLVARNLWLIHSKTNGDFDPSEIKNVYGESANLPGSRSYGFNLRLNF